MCSGQMFHLLLNCRGCGTLLPTEDSPEFSLLPTVASAPGTQEAAFSLITAVSCDTTKLSEGRCVWEKPFISLFQIFIAFV